MRYILVLLSLFFSLNTFAQTKQKQATSTASAVSYTITKAKLMEVKLWTDIVKDFPIDYDRIDYELSYRAAGNVRIQSGSGMELSSGLLKVLSNIDTKSTFYLSLKTEKQKKFSKRSYSITLVD